MSSETLEVASIVNPSVTHFGTTTEHAAPRRAHEALRRCGNPSGSVEAPGYPTSAVDQLARSCRSVFNTEVFNHTSSCLHDSRFTTYARVSETVRNILVIRRALANNPQPTDTGAFIRGQGNGKARSASRAQSDQRASCETIVCFHCRKTGHRKAFLVTDGRQQGWLEHTDTGNPVCDRTVGGVAALPGAVGHWTTSHPLLEGYLCSDVTANTRENNVGPSDGQLPLCARDECGILLDMTWKTGRQF